MQSTDVKNPVRELQARFFCNAASWVDCTALRYHCTKLPDVDLCPEAFADGRFPPGCTARDFIKIDGNRAPPVSAHSMTMLAVLAHTIRQGLAEMQSHVSSLCSLLHLVVARILEVTRCV